MEYKHLLKLTIEDFRVRVFKFERESNCLRMDKGRCHHSFSLLEKANSWES